MYEAEGDLTGARINPSDNLNEETPIGVELDEAKKELTAWEVW